MYAGIFKLTLKSRSPARPSYGMTGAMSHYLKLAILIAVALAAMLVAFLIAPIAQDPAYHRFADQRQILGIAHFWNVISNIPLVVVGLVGIGLLISGPVTGGVPRLRTGYLVVFVGTILTGLGSGYYHLSPSNQTLVWDRLPMTIAFMAFFAAILGENIAVIIGRRALWPLIFAGIAAVVYWDITETRGHGDLAPYVLAQFLPMLLIPLVLILFPSRLSNNIYLWAVIATYALAKVAEQLDAAIFQWLGIISGHTLKHLLAALCGYFLLLALQRRRLADRPGALSR